jgi:hypothetical protein
MEPSQYDFGTSGSLPGTYHTVDLQSDPLFPIAYVVTSNGRDAHADMALVSMLSVQATNPGLRIVMLCDAISAQETRDAKHRILDVCDEMIAVDTPDGSPSLRNRWVKTTLPRHIGGRFLYIDNDTLVRGSLGELSLVQADFAAVANHSGTGSPSEMPATERTVFETLAWEHPLNVYVNGGVLFCAGTEPGKLLFERWHTLWQASMAATGKHFDQAALNYAVATTKLEFAWLPAKFNAQIHARPCVAKDAVIWHIYSSGHHPSPRNALDDAVESLQQGKAYGAAEALRTCQRRSPWLISEPVGWYARHSLQRRKAIISGNMWELFWLSGARARAISLWFSGAKRVARVLSSRMLGRLSRGNHRNVR